MRTYSRWIVAAGVIAFALGMGADDLIRAKRFQVFNSDGKPAVTITEAGGNGQIIVFNDKGEEVFAVKSGKVTGLEVNAAMMREELTKLRSDLDATKQQIATVAQQLTTNQTPLAATPPSPNGGIKLTWMQEADFRGSGGSLKNSWVLRVKVKNEGPKTIAIADLLIELLDREGDVVFKPRSWLADDLRKHEPTSVMNLAPGETRLMWLPVDDHQYGGIDSIRFSVANLLIK